jgi:ribosome maturation protein Sdo1
MVCSESSLDDVLQIENVFVNVSKGEVAKAGDLQKAFGTTEISGIVKEVCLSICNAGILYSSLCHRY